MSAFAFSVSVSGFFISEYGFFDSRSSLVFFSFPGIIVVIELKAGEADRDAIGQILGYMGDKLGVEKSVRGVLVAGDFTPRAIAAARAARNIELRRYEISFSFAGVLLDATH